MIGAGHMNDVPIGGRTAAPVSEPEKNSLDSEVEQERPREESLANATQTPDAKVIEIVSAKLVDLEKAVDPNPAEAPKQVTI